MLKAVRTGAVAVGLALLGIVACDDGDDGEGVEQLVAREDEVAALDPALASRLPPGATFQMAEEGRKLFLVCAVCHGLDGTGTELGPALHDPEWIGISGELEEIEAVIRNGVPQPEDYPIPMPVMGGGAFTEDQIRALAAYVYVISREAS